jgi:hypothetical protein
MEEKVTFKYSLKEMIFIRALCRPGIVLEQAHNENGITYRVAYWNDGVRKCEWLFGFEIRNPKQNEIFLSNDNVDL